MSDMQHIEIERYHDEIIHDMRKLVEKYRKAMDWDIPENNEIEADQLIFDAIQHALDSIKQGK
ncbi:MAG TPA: hypothetical protein ENJ60_03560 [Aeromonadales bacterium]|nr:hypothetical protein [Aeromonadales bacterium]